MLSSEWDDRQAKEKALINAGWTRDIHGYWRAPNCLLGQEFPAAWQDFLRGKSCAETLVKKVR